MFVGTVRAAAPRGRVRFEARNRLPEGTSVEILSPSTEKRDTVIKRKKYMETGVREYWIVDLKRRSVFVYLKDDPIGRIHPLSGKLPVAIYNGELEMDLDAIAAIIERWPEED